MKRRYPLWKNEIKQGVEFYLLNTSINVHVQCTLKINVYTCSKPIVLLVWMKMMLLVLRSPKKKAQKYDKKLHQLGILFSISKAQ